MNLLDLTLSDPAQNLALDQALLDSADHADQGPESGAAPCVLAAPPFGEVLRIWESPRPLVVVGRSSRIADEVDLAECRRRGIPVHRRASGGAAVVVGPGCLMYAVVLAYTHRPELRAIDGAHRFVLEALAAALGRVVPGVRRRGTSDLVVDGRGVYDRGVGEAPASESDGRELKFSGNSMRCQREHLLYHGTLLYDFPIDLIAACLRTPPRQPSYRAGRSHAQFVANLPIGRPSLRAAVAAAFGPTAPLEDWPRESVRQLVNQRYGRRAWNEAR